MTTSGGASWAADFASSPFDNRDVVLCRKFDAPDENPDGHAIQDMARDPFGVPDEPGVESTDVVEQWMDGMIVKAVADRRPEKVRSLSLIHAAAAIEARFIPGLEVAREAPIYNLDRTVAIELFVAEQALRDAETYPFEEAWKRDLGARSCGRGRSPAGVMRQRLALVRSIGGRFAGTARATSCPA